MKGNSRQYLIAFNMISGIGGRRLLALQKSFGSLGAAWRASRQALLKVPGIGTKLAANICGQRSSICPYQEERWAQSLGAEIVTLADPNYPRVLERLAVPPPVLYVRGSLPQKKGIAVVGSRRPSLSGVEEVRKFTRALARQGIAIISGMARGIDFHAHQSALNAAGYTAAVLGSNLGSLYPAEHSALAEKIAESGAVLTEFSSRCPTVPGNFPRRNRIIAGLSQAVLVVQASRKSGAINTANWALELGLDVWAIPGDISDPLRQGTNNLIKEGAFPATEVDDLLDYSCAWGH
ncbi:MAG: DNA-protecting protein DprA [Firmicutes bacterium]|nr:DNA-protecting protein DprA [Bacillota bacterium]